MMQRIFEGHEPQISPKSWVADDAVVVGDVIIGDYSSIWHNCTLRGDVERIQIGRYSNVQDNSVLHSDHDVPTVIGDYVTIGHGAIVHACTVEDDCLIGMGAILLSGCRIGRGSIVGAGTVVREGQVVPPHTLAVGTPARLVRDVSDQLESVHEQALWYKQLWSERWGYAPGLDGDTPTQG